MLQQWIDKLTVYSMYTSSNVIAFLSAVDWLVVLTTTAVALRLIYDTVKFLHWFRYERKNDGD